VCEVRGKGKFRFGVQVLGYMVYVQSEGVQGSGCRVQGSGFRV
jgi:hypothetical protein